MNEILTKREEPLLEQILHWHIAATAKISPLIEARRKHPSPSHLHQEIPAQLDAFGGIQPREGRECAHHAMIAAHRVRQAREMAEFGNEEELAAAIALYCSVAAHLKRQRPWLLQEA